MPQPSLGFLLQSFPLAGIARPSRGRWLPCGHRPTCVEDALVGPCHRRFLPTPTLARGGLGSPVGYELPFPAPKRGSRSLRAPASGIVPLRQLHPLRSFVPPANPFATTQVAPSRRSLLSWTSSPLKSSPPTSRTLRARPDLAARTPPCTRRRRRATPGTSQPQAPGGFAKEHECSTAFPSAASSPLRGWPGPPLGGRPPPMASGGERTRRP